MSEDVTEVEAGEEATDEGSTSTSSIRSPTAPQGGSDSGASCRVFIDSLAGQVNQDDVYAMIVAQRNMLGRVEKSNEMLVYCNMLAAHRFATACQELRRHTQLLQDTKKQLDNVFRRIREIKHVLMKQHPQAFQCAQQSLILSPDEETYTPPSACVMGEQQQEERGSEDKDQIVKQDGS